MHIQQVLRPRHRPTPKHLSPHPNASHMPTLIQEPLQTPRTPRLTPRPTLLAQQSQLTRRDRVERKPLIRSRVCRSAPAHDRTDDREEDYEDEGERGVNQDDGARLLGELESETAGDEEEGERQAGEWGVETWDGAVQSRQGTRWEDREQY